jgi:hypothetical protein
VLWALRTNINRVVRDTPFNLVYGVAAELSLEIYLVSIRVAHFNTEDRAERTRHPLKISMLHYLPVCRLKGLTSPTAKMISLKKEMTCSRSG